MSQKQNPLEISLMHLLENDLDDQQKKELLAWSKEDPQAVEFYCAFIRDYSIIKSQFANSINFSYGSSLDTHFDRAIWDALIENEKTAPVVEVIPPKDPRILVEKVQHEKVVRKISKSSLFSLAAAAAAIVLVFVFIRFAPPVTGYKVAVLADSMNAQWASMDNPMEKGASIFSSRENLLLRSGFAKLLFDNQTQVTVEGPAEFQILDEEKINLRYGRLYAVVPSQAIGFTVCTQTARVIDLGTEFGVSVDVNGDTSLYVMQGKTMLIAGERSSKISMEVQAGKAKKASDYTRPVVDIEFRKDIFVRTIDSDTNVVWKGQKTIDLADIVGGGNGLGTGKRGSYIDAASGQWKPLSEIADQPKESDNLIKRSLTYTLVPSCKFVDGVFVPDGRNGPVQVSSQGHAFGEIPDTTGTNWGGIINVERVIKKQIVLNDVLYGTSQRPALFMHANGGITFDLEKIRRAFSGRRLTAFEAVYGMSETCPDLERKPCADFWVLVDGKLKFSQKNVQMHQGGPLEIPLSDSDRFLTLITTDAGDQGGKSRESLNDWCVFGQPRLRVQ